MATTTTNLGLTKPAYADDADIAVINGNMDILDTKIGAVGSTDLQSQVTTLNSKIRSGSDGSVNLNNYITTGMYAFNGGTSTNAPASGASTLIVQRYSNDWISQMATIITANGSEVYVRDYHDGTTWSSWEKLALNSKIANVASTGIDAPSDITISNNYSKKQLSIVSILFKAISTNALGSGGWRLIGTIHETGFRPSSSIYTTAFDDTNAKGIECRVDNDGKIYVYVDAQQNAGCKISLVDVTYIV